MTVVEGTVTRAGAGAAGLRVICVEEGGVSPPGPPEQRPATHPRIHVRGEARTDDAGRFRIEFEPATPLDDADGRDGAAYVSVRVVDANRLLWSSHKRAMAASVDFSHDLDRDDLDRQDVEVARDGGTLMGRITLCDRPAAGYRVVAHQMTQIGVPVPPDPCRIGTHNRTLGSTVLGSDGRFSFSFQPANDAGHSCFFSDTVHIEVFDGSTLVWRSPDRDTGQIVHVNRDLGGDCGPDTTVVRVTDDRGRLVDDAEVFVNGRRRGSTDRKGQALLPELRRGDALAARKLVHQQATERGGHGGGSRDENWSYRAYVTSVALAHDGQGDDVELRQHVVEDPADVQRLRLSRNNPLIGLNLVASVEWRVTTTELRRYRDRLVDMGELLYNATDGQFCVEHVAVHDDARHWDDADVRVHASLAQPSNATLRGIFGSSGRINMNPNDTHYPGTLLHELGHYAFGMGDEYKPGEDSDVEGGGPPCTLQSLDNSGPYRSGGRKDSCLMRGNRFENRKKFCSNHPDNPHARGTAQGDEACWDTLLRHWADPSRWRLRSPTSRGRIIDRLPDSGVRMPTTTAPTPEVETIESSIPVREWKARGTGSRTRPIDRCENLVVRVTRDGEPVDGARVRLESGGRTLEQGETKARRLAYGVTTDTGEITVRGGHVGDVVRASTAFPRMAYGSAEVQACNGTVTVALEGLRLPWLQVASEVPGTLRVETEQPEGLTMVAVSAVLDGSARPLSLPLAEGPAQVARTVLQDVPSEGQLDLQVVTVAADGSEVPLAAAATFRTLWVAEDVRLRSADGRVELHAFEGALTPPCQLVIADGSGDFPAVDGAAEIVAGPYRLTCSPDDALSGQVLLHFELPWSDTPGEPHPDVTIVRFDPAGRTWHEVESTVVPDPFVVTASLDRLGTYALARRGRAANSRLTGPPRA